MYGVLDVCEFIIRYSNDKGYGVSNLKLQKLLYFIQAYFLVQFNRPCFIDKIVAWDFGPVVPKAYHEFKGYASSNIPNYSNLLWEKYEHQYLEKNDEKIISQIIDVFAKASATDLVTITHMQDPWKKAYRKGLNKEISIESIKEYFSE